MNTCILFFLCNNRSGKPTYFSAVFNTHSPGIKQSWISNLQMAKLALGTLHCLFLNYLLCMTVYMFSMTFIIKTSESEKFAVRYSVCFTLQSMSQSAMTHWVMLVLSFFSPDEDNLQGWFFAEDDGNQIKKQKHPLLLRQMPVVMSKLQEFKVRLLCFPKICQF